MHIGTFTPAKDGGWIGYIRTLTIDAKVRLVPNDDRSHENAPDFRIFVGNCRIGDAWRTTSQGEDHKNYVQVRFDDPSLPRPLVAALFPSDEGDSARLIWRRQRDA